MEPTANIQIADLQSSRDSRNLPIRQVGIKDIRHPAQVQTRDGGKQAVAAEFSLFANLPADVKGTHMSRFVALLNAEQWCLSVVGMGDMARRVQTLLNSRTAYVSADFLFFVRKQAPVSREDGWMDYQVQMIAEADAENLSRRIIVQVPVKSLCPCSKKISDYGAHNQRSKITISACTVGNQAVAIEDFIDIAEDIASCQLYSVLKRPDEKFVTEQAYENPKFVEDMVRDLANRLSQDTRLQSFVVEAENLESIHNHSAYACVSSDDVSRESLTELSLGLEMSAPDGRPTVHQRHDR